MAEPATVRSTFRWADIFFARSRAGDSQAALIQLILVVGWHWTIFPATLVAVDWLLGYGASSGGTPLPPRPFDIGRTLDYFLHPFFATSYLTVLLVEGLLSWFTFRLRMRRRGLSFRVFARYWWRVCVWGVLAMPVASVGFAMLSKNYDAAMNFPLLWVLWGIIGPALLVSIDFRRRHPPGHCQNCGYNLTGNVSGRCPECGTPPPTGSP